MIDKNIGRDVLPVPDRPYTGLIKFDADHMIHVRMAKQ